MTDNYQPSAHRMTSKTVSTTLLVAVLIATIGADKEPPSGGARRPFAPGPAIPLVRLIANPEKYDGQRVVVHGYARMDFEGTALYMTKDDADYEFTENSIWIGELAKGADHGLIEKRKPGFVCIEGTFQMAKGKTGKGMWGMWSAEIRDITALVKCAKQH
jgi:hypothetical protein